MNEKKTTDEEVAGHIRDSEQLLIIVKKGNHIRTFTAMGLTEAMILLAQTAEMYAEMVDKPPVDTILH